MKEAHVEPDLVCARTGECVAFGTCQFVKDAGEMGKEICDESDDGVGFFEVYVLLRLWW